MDGSADAPGGDGRGQGAANGSTDDFGRTCLLARRLVETGVRFVEISHGDWDQHSNPFRPCAGTTGSSCPSASKADRLPHEAGLRLRKPPVAPRVVLASALIGNHHGVQDWEHFLG